MLASSRVIGVTDTESLAESLSASDRVDRQVCGGGDRTAYIVQAIEKSEIPHDRFPSRSRQTRDTAHSAAASTAAP
jgi:hypothetical protein